jgi:pimeloyl-ACP methyl ester carboxylesterase
VTRSSRALLAGAVAATLLVSGCSLFSSSGDTHGTTAAKAGSSAPSGPAGVWRSCPEVASALVGSAGNNNTYECTTIKVPRDWSAKGAAAGTNATPGSTFDISLIRVRAKNQANRIGSLVVNPGGPGGSGVDLAVYLSVGAAKGGLPDDVTRRFDIVGFDPRGVGQSTPVKCISDSDMDATFGYDPDPTSQADYDGLVALNKRIADGCAAKYGNTLSLFSTEQAAHDMDAVRAAVGDPKMTYLGYSYGTLLGATYAQLFPKNIRALVLDGAVDPKQDAIASSESQAKGFELAFNNFATWCKSNRSKCPIAPDARAAVTSALDKARSSPVRGSGGREATAGWIFYAVVSSLYTESGWQQLASAIDKLQAGDPSSVFELADAYAERGSNGKYSNLFDANAAVNCADEATKPSVTQVRQLQNQWRQKYPLFGASLAVGLLTCTQWPGKADPYPTGAATGAPPIVVVGTTGDPATPYEQTPKLANMLGVGVVLTWQGEGHTAYPQTRCITNAVNRYLIDLTVPAKGTTCPAQ